MPFSAPPEPATPHPTASSTAAGGGRVPGAWRSGAGLAAGAAGVALCLRGGSGWLELAGLFLATLGVHLWVLSRQRV